jgi:polyamine oxidase
MRTYMKVVRQITYNDNGAVVTTEDSSSYSADYVMVSTSLGVLQSDLIKFTPQLPVSSVICF